MTRPTVRGIGRVHPLPLSVIRIKATAPSLAKRFMLSRSPRYELLVRMKSSATPLSVEAPLGGREAIAIRSRATPNH